MVSESAGKAVGIILYVLVFGIFIISASMRIRQNKKIRNEKDDPGTINQIGIIFDAIILFFSLIIFFLGIGIMCSH